MNLSEELRGKLIEKGASVVGFADLSELPEKDRGGYRYGIIIGLAAAPEIILGIGNGPTIEYYMEYDRLNADLGKLGEYAETLLKSKGYHAVSQTKKVVRTDESNCSTELPYKTVATRAGIGWIGKCALLITEECGAAIRIMSVLTNAELDAGTPVNSSKCGDCNVCKNICPASAVSGVNWEVGLDRDEYYNAFECRKTARERSGRIGVQKSLCGLCILMCPWTQKYLKRGFYSITGGLEQLPVVKPLWEGLREHHSSIASDFAETIGRRSFEERAGDFEGKAGNHIFRIELIRAGNGGYPMGYCISSLSDSLVGEVDSIFVYKAYRGLNIGDTLMINALKWMDDHNAKSKRISVMAGNDVLGFYGKYGFKVRTHILEQVDNACK